MTKKEIKQQHKPWITIGIRKSIERREHLYKKIYKSQEHSNQGRIS